VPAVRTREHREDPGLALLWTMQRRSSGRDRDVQLDKTFANQWSLTRPAKTTMLRPTLGRHGSRRSGDLEVACEAAIAGAGLARLPSLVCREAVTDGRLRLLFGPASAMRRSVYSVFPSRRYLPAKVRLFLEALAARCSRSTCGRTCSRRAARAPAPPPDRAPFLE
jgi:DNA-binding transcriptional LysR family regulator